MLLKAVPVLPAVNMRESVDFYTCKMGFTGINMGSYAVMKCRDTEIHLSMASAKQPFQAAGCYIITDDIECLFADFSARDLVYPKGQLVSKARGIREFSIKDNNGNLIRFGQKK